MLMKPAQSMRFVRLVDELTIFANDKLMLLDEEELLSGPRNSIDAEAQEEVMVALWEQPELIQAFLDERADLFSRAEQREVQAWAKGALPGTFTAAYLPDGRLAMLCGGYAFAVQGIAREIDTLLADVPCYLKTMLLPYGDAITYAVVFQEMPIELGPGARKAVEDEVGDIVAAGKVISTAKGLQTHAREVLDAMAQEKRLRAERRSAYAAEAAEPAAGHHRGALAGLSPDERKEALRVYEQAQLDAGKFDDFADLEDPAYRLSVSCRSGSPKFKAAQLLGLLKKAELDDIAQDFSVPGTRGLKKAQLVNRLVDAFRDPSLDHAFLYVETVHLAFLPLLKRVVDAGGRLELHEADLPPVSELSPPLEPVLFLFGSRGKYTYVVPDEFMDAMRALDWDELERRASLRADVGRFAMAITHLRGIVSLSDFVGEWKELHPEFADDQGILRYMMQNAMQLPLYDVLVTSDEGFLLEHELTEEYYEENLDAEWEEGSPMLMGELDDVLYDILDAQDGKEPRPVEPAMLDYPLPVLWRFSLPGVEELRAWLDANVPDGADDYTFADDVLFQFSMLAKWGSNEPSDIADYLEVLSDAGFDAGPAHIQAFLDLLRGYLENQPTWNNNGWAPIQVDDHMDREPEHRIVMDSFEV